MENSKLFYSPLRYPGGKNKLATFLAKICVDNKLHSHYIEPYAGGASVALFLLLEGYVKRITINDKDKSIFAFWYSVLNFSEELCELIDSTIINIENWHKFKKIQKEKDVSNLLELGFSTLFLNRTNRSGIITGGVIGGINQSGNYKIDCRFNKENIKSRIRLIAEHKDSIRLFNLDALDLINQIIKEPNDAGTILYFDPPYYLKADSLYLNHYFENDHLEVSEKIKSIDGIQWIVSYDDHEFIEKLYTGFLMKKYSFNHSAAKARQGREILIFSHSLKQPSVDDYNPTRFKLKYQNKTKNIIYSHIK